jgi:NDP-sugar pyrophosphorylase family protein
VGKVTLVILAAGRGRRLAPFTDHTPKALIEFEGKTITEMAIEAFAPYIDKVVITVGHLHTKIMGRLGASHAGVPIIYVHNRHYAETGAASSLLLAKNEFAGRDCVIMEGDHLFHPRLAKKLMGSIHAGYMNCVLVTTRLPVEFCDQTFVIGAERPGIVKRFAWPAKDLTHKERLDVIGVCPTIFKLSPSASVSLAANLRGGGEIIAPLNRVIKRHRMHYWPTLGLPWLEIDTPEDLAQAQLVYERIKAI